MSENGEIYTAGKNFTLPPAVTAWTNSTSVCLLHEFDFSYEIQCCLAIFHCFIFAHFLSSNNWWLTDQKRIKSNLNSFVLISQNPNNMTILPLSSAKQQSSLFFQSVPRGFLLERLMTFRNNVYVMVHLHNWLLCIITGFYT